MNTNRRANGAVYTPVEVARRIVDQVLTDWFQEPRNQPLDVLDPACGEGVFLLECRRWLSRRGLKGRLYGFDIDARAVQRTQMALGADGCVFHGNALISPEDLVQSQRRELLAFDWRTAVPAVAGRGGFDLVIGNPPYVNIRRIHQGQPAAVKRLLRERYCTATGNFDLYVLFCERALEWLKPAGRFAMIVPNKIATLEYARECRNLLLNRTQIDRISDLSELKVFPGTGVYPYVLTWTNSQAPAQHCLQVDRYRLLSDFQRGHPADSTTVKQNELSSDGFHFGGRLDLEERVATVALDEVAELHSGTTGFVAQRLADELCEQPRSGKVFPFVVSGNIDRYQLRMGRVRFMKRSFESPVLPMDSSVISDGKRQLFSEPKIAIAGMTRRLEATWCEFPLALGVQVYAATRMAMEPLFVLGLLNSKLMTYLFRQRFAAKRLSGGFMSINKSQLARLPIRCVDHGDEKRQRIKEEMISLVARRCASTSSAANEEGERRIDSFVYQLYDLTNQEIAEVEAAVESIA